MIEIDSTGKNVTFMVSATTPVTKLGSAIAHGVYADKTVTVRAIGAGAISQAMKAVAVANGFAAPRGIQLAVAPAFTDADMPDRTVTAMALKVLVL
jgi:stage V sporulation protein S